MIQDRFSPAICTKPVDIFSRTIYSSVQKDEGDHMTEVAETGTLQRPGLDHKIYCANCLHCKLVKMPTEDGNKYHLRVRCDAGKWRKKLGEEKLYKYFTVARRSEELCKMYVSMGESKDFLRDLKKSLPIRDEVYHY